MLSLYIGQFEKEMTCRWGLEYTDCILRRGVRPTPTKNGDVLSMKLNCICSYGQC